MIRVGTSGWLYDHWDGTFYPEDLPRTRWGAYYRSRFPVVELNATFYRLPTETTILKWLREARGGFRYVIKGSRYITHIRRLADCEDPVTRFVNLVTPLQPALLALLWQLPPNLARDDALLAGFLDLLPRTAGGAPLRHAVEFRHRSWITSPVHDLLAAHDIANVWVSSHAMPADFTRTADFTYARFHGLEGGWEHDYTEAELAPFTEALCAAGCDGVAFFNNDGRGRAPHNADLFTRMLGDTAVRWDPPPDLRDAVSAGRRRA
jgi:uncharacterized protein YecE (DUF72 family)